MPRASSSSVESHEFPGRPLVGKGQWRRLGHRPQTRALGVMVLVLVALLAGCGLLPRVSMAEVLDGPATSEARLAAIGRVEQWPQGLSVPGVSEVARQTYTTCVEGQNSLWVHDGYRLKCAAHSLVYFGWDGGYAKGRDRMLSAMASFCVSDGSDVVAHAPSDTSTVLGPNYSCPPALYGLSMILSGQAEEVLVTGGSWGVIFDDQRWIDGPRDDALLKQLHSRRWLFAVDVGSVFFQDPP